MADHHASVRWERGTQVFTDRRYSRRYLMAFDGGASVPGSSSPHTVKEPYSDAAAVDPEEAYVAALAGCHMLWFLDIACRAGWQIDDYRDEAVGTLAPDAAGRLVMTVVTLRPRVSFGAGRVPGEGEHARLHHQAHAECFLANSVKTEIRCEPSIGS